MGVSEKYGANRKQRKEEEASEEKPTSKRRSKMWYIHTVEYYSALTKNEILIHMLQRRRISRTSRRVKKASYSAHEVPRQFC